MTDRKLARGAVAALAGVGALLLVVAARTDGYWQALLINLGTGVLLFVALEHALYGPAERLTTVITEAFRSFSAERGLELWSWADTLSSEERQALARELQATYPLPTTQLEGLQRELQAVDQMNADENVKRISYLAVLTNKYGVQRVRQVIASTRAAATPPPDTRGA